MLKEDLIARIAALGKSEEQALSNYHMCRGQKFEAESLLRHILNAEAQEAADAAKAAIEQSTPSAESE